MGNAISNLEILNVSITDKRFIIAPFVYLVYFAIFLSFFTHKFKKQRVSTEYMIIICSYFTFTFCFICNNLLQLYEPTNCVIYLMTRIIYLCNFFNVNFTLYNFIRDFSRREVDVINVKLIGYILLALNIIVCISALIAFSVFASLGTECVSNNGSAEAWNTWVSLVSMFLLGIIVLVMGIVLIVRYKQHIEHAIFPDSKKIFFIYIIASGFLIFESIIRICAHLYYPISHKYMDNSLFQALSHWIPDLIEMICLCLFLYSSSLFIVINHSSESSFSIFIK